MSAKFAPVEDSSPSLSLGVSGSDGSSEASGVGSSPSAGGGVSPSTGGGVSPSTGGGVSPSAGGGVSSTASGGGALYGSSSSTGVPEAAPTASTDAKLVCNSAPALNVNVAVPVIVSPGAHGPSH